MSDADLIYHACLRAEKRLEERLAALPSNCPAFHDLSVAQETIEALRQEIGAGMAKERI